MEHIRAAIDKARKERQNAQKPGTEPSAPADRPARGVAKAGDAGRDAVAEAWQALPTFDATPERLRRARILTYQANHDATHFDAMRTTLLHEMRSNSWRRLAITSPGAQCGKTTIALNLAFSLARQPDIRVMVIELDLRRPSIARMLRLQGDLNFAMALAGRAPADEHMQRHGSNLAIAASHGSAQSPAELLQGASAAHVIDEVEARYRPDVMIFDMPPMLLVDDTMAFIGQVDTALLVAAAEASTLEGISRCKEALEDRTDLMGVVLNKCRYLDAAGEYDYY